MDARKVGEAIEASRSTLTKAANQLESVKVRTTPHTVHMLRQCSHAQTQTQTYATHASHIPISPSLSLPLFPVSYTLPHIPSLTPLLLFLPLTPPSFSQGQLTRVSAEKDEAQSKLLTAETQLQSVRSALAGAMQEVDN